MKKHIRATLMEQINFIRLILCLALLSIQFAIPSPVSACSCVESGSPVNEFIASDAVFTGQVTSVSSNSSPITYLLARMLDAVNIYPSYLYTDQFWGYDVTFAVQKSWKSISTTSVTLQTGSGGGDCGYLFSPGDDYLVYAYQLNDSWGTSICSRTTHISLAAEDLTYLNTIPTLPLTPVYDYSWLIFTGVALLVFISLLGLAIVLRRRRQQSQTPPNDQFSEKPS